MDQSWFKRMSSRLQAQGLTISESRYDRKAFGNWFIVVETHPRLRVVWDGRDAWIYVERETDDRTPWGASVWENVWTLQKPQDYEAALIAAVNEIQRVQSLSS